VVDGTAPKQATNVEPQISLLVRRMEFDPAKDPPSGEFLVTYDINPGFFFPGPYDEILEVRNGIKLSKTQWVRIMNEATGRVQVKQGELVYFLNETEIVLGEEVNEGYDVNEFQAVLVESSEDGQKRLVKPSPGQKNLLFIPGAYDTVLEIRQLVHVQPHEAVVTIDEAGTYRFFQNENGTSFFLDPYDHLVTMRWSTGNILDEKETEIITKIDQRSQNLYFDFEVRTSDNVRLQLEGVVRWKVINVEQMIQGTRDPRGDVWHHSRHVLLQAVSKIDLQDFMKNFNARVKAAFEQDRVNGTSFYTERGVLVESMEVTGYQCVDAKTADILQEIIRETTNRINRMQKQESENDVARAKLEAEIRLEKKRTDLLTTKASNDRLVSEMEGEANGLKLAKSAQTFLSALGGVNATLPDVASRLELYRLHQDLASKNDTTSNLASGSAMLFVTPDEVNLNLKNDEL
jgi:regulator of protease activity HflC (stomatin/prohibitin superfamily)